MKRKQIPIFEVHVDTQVINTAGLGASLLQMCESVGVQYVALDQLMTNTVTWHTKYESDTGTPRMEEEDEVLVIIPGNDFIAMAHNQVMKTEGEHCDRSLTDYIRQLQHIYPQRHVSALVLDVEKYFSDKKRDVKRKRKKEFAAKEPKTRHNGGGEGGTILTRFQVEEVVVATQLETGCCCQLVNSEQEVVEVIKCFTKAIMDKPSKKNRFDSVFSFLEAGSSGVRADKTGNGLVKVWKLQLQQLHNLGPDVATAIVTSFPSPLALKQAYVDHPNQTAAWKVTESISIRRGAGALETQRRVGQQLSKRIHTLITCDDPDVVVK